MNFTLESEITAKVIFLGYLCWISFQDYESMQVVRYSHLTGLLAVLLEIIINRDQILYSFCSYVVAGMVMALFQAVSHRCHFYGLADTITIYLCSIFFLVKHGPDDCLLFYYLLQAIAGVLLIPSQVFKGNVKKLRLKRPVPYIPYISVAFILTNIVL